MTETAICPICGGVCRNADLSELLSPDLMWLWHAVADAGDRRGDPVMTNGPAVTLTLPDDASERAAAAGLVKAGRPGQRVRLRLGELDIIVKGYSPNLTPGAVAAHAVGRPLGEKAGRRRAKAAHQQAVRAVLTETCNCYEELAGHSDDLYEALRSSGLITRRQNGNQFSADIFARSVHTVATILRLPEGDHIDRRVLDPDNPHALDDGEPEARIVLRMLATLGRVNIQPGMAPRLQWSQVGVDFDDIVGGLAMLTMLPVGWALPRATVLTIPPRELVQARWPSPVESDEWCFVTENPSVIAAAANMFQDEPHLPASPVVCTMGTPATLEIETIAHMAEAGWHIAVRADFDPAGIRHVTSELAGVPGAVPWRMSARDFCDSGVGVPFHDAIPPTPWDPDVQAAMARHQRITFEEAVLPNLLDDLRSGRPS